MGSSLQGSEAQAERDAARECAAGAPRALIVADVRLYREGLAWSIAQTGRMVVVGTADTGAAAVARATELAADVVIIDTAMPDAFAIARALGCLPRRPKIVALAIADMEGSVVECAEAGLDGFVTRNCSLEDLVAVVEHAVRGELRCSPQVAATLFRRIGTLSAGRADARSGVLTEREREIVALIERGLSNKEIGRQLAIGTATVKNHVHNILEKLGVRRRHEAAARLRNAAPGVLADRIVDRPLEPRI